VSRPLAFTQQWPPTRVVFSRGALRSVGEEAARLGTTRALVIAPPRLTHAARQLLGERVARVIDDAVMHVPAPRAAEALAAARAAQCDGLVALGGGSPIGLAKAVARETGLPILAVPTTFSGSEGTAIWGLTEGGVKRTGRDERVRPRTVIYDPELTASLPASLAGPSGVNAMAHAVEAMYAPRTDPVTALLAEEAVRALARSLPRVVGAADAHDGVGAADAHDDDGEDGDPQERALFGAWLASVCLDRAQMGIHHKLCHTLGGAFGLPHAAVHALILPYAVAFNYDAAPSAMRRLMRALGASDPPAALFTLVRTLGAPASLAELGLKRGDLDRAAQLATESPYENPRPVDRAGVRALLDEAFAGAPPGHDARSA
jgi:maleylacetate reductase